MFDHTGTPPDVTVSIWYDVVASLPEPGVPMFAAAVTCKAPAALPYTIPFEVNVLTPVPPNSTERSVSSSKSPNTTVPRSPVTPNTVLVSVAFSMNVQAPAPSAPPVRS